MARVLLYQGDPSIARGLHADLKTRGWSMDVCTGLLETLRLVERNEYAVVVFNATHWNIESSLILAQMETLKRKPKILLNLNDSLESSPAGVIPLDYEIIRGDLTSEKILKAAERTLFDAVSTKTHVAKRRMRSRKHPIKGNQGEAQ